MMQIIKTGRYVLSHMRHLCLLLIFGVGVTTIGIVAVTAILHLTSTVETAVEQAKKNLDAVTTARVSTMAMEQSLYHLVAARNSDERRSAAISAIKGASFHKESLQRLSDILPTNQKVTTLYQLNKNVSPIRMEMITHGMHGDMKNALEKLHAISPMTLQIDALSQEILSDGQRQLINVAKINAERGLKTIWLLSSIITVVLVISIIVVISNVKLQVNRQRVIDELKHANQQLEQAQNQLVQSEKMVSIGLLAAGVAHEINNPIGYVFSNFGTLEHYHQDLLGLIQEYVTAEASIVDTQIRNALTASRDRIQLDYLRDDIVALMRESRDGIERVCKIVQDLKNFSHVDSSNEWQLADLQQGLESTLNIVNNEIKYHADVVREFNTLPQIECLPWELNQVFMNLLVNAAHAMENLPRGVITVRTGTDGTRVWVEISDTGCGIPAEITKHIFDPFFTTKPVGKGTGLGLSLSYGIIKKHHGDIKVESEVGRGTQFRITLPIEQPISQDS